MQIINRKRAPLTALLVANAISMVGNVIATIAIPWFVLQSTNSPAKTGVTGFFTTLAAVIAAFFGGAIVDRLGFKRTSITADIASGVAVALIPLLYFTVGLQYWHLLVLVFAGAFLDAPGTTAREALMPDLTELAGMSLEQAGAANQAVERGARMVGAPLAGLLIAVMGTENVLWLDAASFAISAAIVWLAVPLLKAQVQENKPRHYLRELKEGIDFIRGDQLVLATLLLVAVVNFLDAPLVAVLYPVYIDEFFGSALNLGLMIAASGGGALASAVLYGAYGYRLPRRAVFFAGFLLVNLRFVVMALVPPFWIILLTALISGLAMGPINPILYAIQYERIPAGYRGRILGTITAVAFIAIPLGVLLGGYVLEFVDVRLVLLMIGAAYLATVLTFYFHPGMREMNVRRQVEALPEVGGSEGA
jgi:MFS family permease